MLEEKQNTFSSVSNFIYALLTGDCIVKAMVFPVMYGCESWTIKKGERQRNDAV